MTAADATQTDALARLAAAALHLWEVPEGAGARLINLSENATYLVEAAGGYRSVLRITAPDITATGPSNVNLPGWRRFMNRAGWPRRCPLPGGTER